MCLIVECSTRSSWDKGVRLFKVPTVVRNQGAEVKELGILRNYDGEVNGNVKKAIGLMSKTTTLHVHHAFLYISLQSLHNYDVKWKNLS